MAVFIGENDVILWERPPRLVLAAKAMLCGQRTSFVNTRSGGQFSLYGSPSCYPTALIIPFCQIRFPLIKHRKIGEIFHRPLM